MRHTPLGQTGVHVSSVALGAMTFGIGADEATSRGVFDRYSTSSNGCAPIMSKFTVFAVSTRLRRSRIRSAR